MLRYHANDCPHPHICELYEDCREQLLKYFTTYCHATSSAEDMVQTLFLKLMSYGDLKAATLRGLVFSTARNMVIDHIRHHTYEEKAQRHWMLSAERVATPTVYDKIDTERLLEIEARYVSSMPARRAEIYRLWRDDTMTAKNIADDMNISVRTVEHQIYLATKGMKAFFQKAM